MDRLTPEVSRRGLGKLVGAGAVTALGLSAGGLSSAAPARAATVSGPPIGRGEVMDRSWVWVNERVPYAQSGTYPAPGGGAYRPDCSGYTSMCWKLDQSYATFTFGDRAMTLPGYADLQPGDALLDRPNHVALFAGWADAAHTKPIVHEEYDFGEVCERRTWESCRGLEPVRISNLDIRIPYGRIAEKWNQLGGAGGVLGPSVNDEFDSKRGGRFRDFANGMIIWHPDQVFAVHGAILTAYRESGSEGAWGFPTMDENAGQAGPTGTSGRYQFFEGALALWAEPTGAHLVHGEILKAFQAAGAEARLGYPRTGEYDAAGGKRQDFEKAYITWTASGGAKVTST